MVRINGTGRPVSVQKSDDGKDMVQYPAASGEQGGGGGEHVETSDASLLREKAQVMLTEMSDVCPDRIEKIRSALDSGAFIFSSRKVAAQIVKNALAEHSEDEL